MYDICDIHSHVLPGMDDGCATLEESLAVLKKMRQSGITRVFATPHYYARETVAAFLQRRQESMALLAAALTEDMPQLICGAEVAWFPGISSLAELDQLCLGQSRYLLLELPFTPWTKQVLRDVENLCLRGFVPILAHYERYAKVQSRQMLERMLDCEPLVQMNASRLLSIWSVGGACRDIQLDKVQLLGSDCHGLHHRPPRLGDAIAQLEKRKLHSALERMAALGEEIFRQARE